MAVEAARDALDLRDRARFASLTLATTRQPFADLQGASIVASALDLQRGTRTLDAGQSPRAGVASLLAQLRAADGPALVIASDHPSAKPASPQEPVYGAGASAFTLGADKVIAELAGSASSFNMFVDHFRATGRKYDYFWEERWIRDEGLAKIVPQAVAAALADAGAQASEVRHFIVAYPLRGAGALVAKRCGIEAGAVADHLDAQCGWAGAAHACLMLAHVLERARPGELIVTVGFGQGVDVIVLRATDAIDGFKPRRGVSGALADALVDDAYLRMLSFDGGIELDWGMRGEKLVKTALSEQHREADQLYGFIAGKCRHCGTVQLPRLAYCVAEGCGASADDSDPQPLCDVPAKVLTVTADWLSYHPAPPLNVGFAQFDNGARLLMEIVDVGPAGLDVGTPLRMSFRIKDVDTMRGYPRYFWKATPVAASY